jgi:hypothetical protein
MAVAALTAARRVAAMTCGSSPTGIGLRAVPVTTGVEQVGDLVEGEPEPLRRLDHPQRHWTPSVSSLHS